MSRRRTVAAGSTLALLAGSLVAALLPVGGAAAQPTADCDNVPNPQECRAGGGHTGSRTSHTITVDVQVGTGPNNLCTGDFIVEGQETGSWRRWDELGLGPPPHDPPAGQPDAVFWALICAYDTSEGSGGWLGALNRFGWGSPTEPPAAQPTPEQIVDALWAEVVGLLEEPAVVLQPAQGLRSTYRVPTFVAITNPQPATTYTTTVGTVTVWIDVVPEHSLHPGEPDAPAIGCDEDGTTYDPAGATPRQQAAVEGACAHSYMRRTGATGRPDAWSGDVTIDWDVTWGANIAGAGGTIAADPSVTSFLRIVDESQVLVSETGD